MPNVLFEIGLEEVPARFVDNCLADLKTILEKALFQVRLMDKNTEILTMGTYRRLVIMIYGIKEKQDDLNDTIFGPPLTIAKDESGAWTQAAIGFASKFNVNIDDVMIQANEKGQDVICVKQDEKGIKANALLGNVLEESILKMKLPIAMKWGNGIGPFIRPVHWVCSILDKDVIPCNIFGVQSSNITYGHRFLSKGDGSTFLGRAITVTHPDDYINQLNNESVCVDISKRKQMIENQMNAYIAKDQIDSALLNEVTHLVEWPTAMKIPFPDQFLALPEEVLIQCLKKHQKAFLIKENDKITNACIVIADSINNTNQQSIIEGNQKVMLARLNDVQFFWDEDLKNSGFSNWNEQLDNIIFQDGLGSMNEKVERICHISHMICDQLNTDKTVRDLIDRAGHRCKSDLVSQMVQEMPALQGIMGAYYSVYFKESPEVSLAIKEHYQPRSESDELPKSIPGIILSISDRLDTIVACFENDNIPTGSRDPWGIRRSMIAIIRMMIQNNLNLDLRVLIEDATLTLGRKLSDKTDACLSFFKKRIETVILDEGIPHDLVQLFDGVMGCQPVQMINQSKVLMDLKQMNSDHYQLLIETTVRVSKIIGKEAISSGEVINDLFVKPIEKDAFETFQSIQLNAELFIINDKSLKDVILFCELLTNYFDDVLINAEDPKVASNRKLFIQKVNQYFQSAGDWLKLVR